MRRMEPNQETIETGRDDFIQQYGGQNERRLMKKCEDGLTRNKKTNKQIRIKMNFFFSVFITCK